LPNLAAKFSFNTVDVNGLANSLMFIIWVPTYAI
jgi:hypothetical protein